MKERKWLLRYSIPFPPKFIDHIYIILDSPMKEPPDFCHIFGMFLRLNWVFYFISSRFIFNGLCFFSLYAFSIIGFVVVVCGIPSLFSLMHFLLFQNHLKWKSNYIKLYKWLRSLGMLILTFVKDLYCLYYQRCDSDGITEITRKLKIGPFISIFHFETET